MIGAVARRGTAVVLVFAAGVLVVAGALLGWTAVPQLWGWRSQVLVSGSMAPVLDRGDIAVTSPADRDRLAAGQVVLIRESDGGTYLHRIVSRTEAGRWITRGDADTHTDNGAIASSAIVGQVRLVLPHAGIPSLWVHDGRPIPLILTGLVLVGSTSALLAAARRRRQAAPGSTPEPPGHAGPHPSRIARIMHPAAATLVGAVLTGAALMPAATHAYFAIDVDCGNNTWTAGTWVP